MVRFARPTSGRTWTKTYATETPLESERMELRGEFVDAR